ncbi:hypothetical protein ABIF60_006514 [Bradyrhizobium japonicum]
MRHREHASLQHGRMAEQDLFHLERRDLLPAAVDDVLDAADDEEIAVSVEIAEIAGPEPAVAEGGLCRRLVVVIAAAHVRSAQHDLATLAARKCTARLVHDGDLGAGGAPDRSDLAQLERVGCDLRGRFGHAVGLEHGNAERRLQPFEDRGRERGRGRADHAQRRRSGAVRVGFRRRQQRAVNGRHGGVPGRLQLPHPAEEGRCIETVGADHAGACGQRRQKAGDQAMGVKQRQDVEQAIVRGERQHAAGIGGGQAYIAMRQRHHLRPRCRARRQQDERIVVAARGARGRRRPDRRTDEFAAAQIVLRSRHEIDHRDIQRLGDVAARRVHVGPGQERGQLQFAEIALQLVRGQIGIDGDAGAARGNRDQRQRAVGAARQCNRNPVGSGDAEPAQRVDKILRHLTKRAVVEDGPTRGEEGGCRWRLAGVEIENAADMGECLGFGCRAA